MARQRKLEVVIAGDASGASRAFQQAGRDGDTFGSKISGAAVLATAAFVAVGAAVVKVGKELYEFGSKALAVSSDVEEFGSRVDVVFGASAKNVKDFAETTTAAYGISNRDALKFLGSLGAQQKGLGMTEEAAAKNAVEIVKLAGDWASFANKEPEEVLQAMESAFRGEYDALQAVIPAINAAKVEQEALALSGKKVTKELTDQEKAQAIMNIMMRESTLAIGDAARTAESWANVSRRLKAQWIDFQKVIGDAILPVMARLGALFERFISSIMPQLTVTFTRLSEHVFPALADAIVNKVEPTLMRLGEVIENTAHIFSEYADQIGAAIRSGDWNAVKDIIREALDKAANDAIKEFFPSWSGIADGGDWEELKRKLGDRLVETITTAIGVVAAHAGKIGAALGLAIGAGLLSSEFTEGIASGLIAGLFGVDIENPAVQFGGKIGGWILKGLMLIALAPGLTVPMVVGWLGKLATSSAILGAASKVGVAISNKLILGLAALLTPGTFAGIGTGIATALSGVAAVIASPVAIIVGIIAGIAAIGYVVWRNWDTISRVASEIWGGIVNFFTGTVGPALSTFFGETLPNAFAGLAEFFTNLPSVIGNALYALAFELIPRAIGEITNFWVNTLPQWIEKWGNTAYEMVGRFIGWLATLPGRAGEWLSQTWERFSTWAGQMIERAGTAAQQLIERFSEWVSQLPGRAARWLGEVITNAQNWARDLPGRIGEGARNAWNSFSEWLSRIPSAIREWLREALNAVGNWAGEIGAAMRRAASSAWQSFKSGFTGSPQSKVELLIRDMVEQTHRLVDEFMGEMGRLEGAASGVPGRIDVGRLLGGVMGIARGGMAMAGGAGGVVINLPRGFMIGTEQQFAQEVQRALREYRRQNGSLDL